MTPQTLKLFELLGSKELTFGCLVCHSLKDCINNCQVEECIIIGERLYNDWKIFQTSIFKEIHQEELNCCGKIIGHPPTIADLHKWLNENIEVYENWKQDRDCIYLIGSIPRINYISSLPLLEQSTETLDAIIELIDNN